MSESTTSPLLYGTENDTGHSFSVARELISLGVTSQKAPRNLGLMAGMVLSVLVPSATACFDPWFHNKIRNTSSIYGLFPSRNFRYVSLAEARRIALEILVNAETERLESADREAARGFSWSEFS